MVERIGQFKKKCPNQFLFLDNIFAYATLVSDANTRFQKSLKERKSMDTKFSVAIHILVMVSESKEQLSSQALATSVGTNASYIRKVIGLLKNAGLLLSQQGKSGYALSKSPSDITLFEIYQATQEVQHIQLFQIHQHANPACPVGKNIGGAVSPIFNKAERELESELSQESLADVIENLYAHAQGSSN